MKCPFCQQELRKDQDGFYTCYTDNCGCMKYGGNGASGSESLWLALIHTRKDLSDKIGKLETELDRTRKALEIAVGALKYANKCIKGGCVNWETEIDRALEQITALEQKDK